MQNTQYQSDRIYEVAECCLCVEMYMVVNVVRGEITVLSIDRGMCIICVCDAGQTQAANFLRTFLEWMR